MSHTLPSALAQYTVQDIHLEIIRRTYGISCGGAELADFLVQNHDLWTAVLTNRHSTMPHRVTPLMQIPFLPQLRDLPTDGWNAPTLYVLAPDEASATLLIEKAGLANIWRLEQVRPYDDFERDYILEELSLTMPNCTLFSVWWG